MSAKPAEIDDDHDAIEWELIELVAEHGSERAALRALLHDFHVLLADADKAVSRGFLRGRRGGTIISAPILASITQGRSISSRSTLGD